MIATTGADPFFSCRTFSKAGYTSPFVLLLAFFFESSGSAQAQTLTTATKNSNAIAIQLPVSGDSALVRVARTLFAHHFTIRLYEPRLGVVTTEERFESSSGSILSFSALVKGQVVTLHGLVRFRGPGGAGVAEPISMGTGQSLRQWKVMDAIAHDLGSTLPLVYRPQ